MKISGRTSRGELRANAFEGEGDPAFFGSDYGDVVVVECDHASDECVEQFVIKELAACQARVQSRDGKGGVIVEYSIF